MVPQTSFWPIAGHPQNKGLKALLITFYDTNA